ncbi:MAG: hypothetical protein ACOCXX_02355 [Planctomycetota bacterium]
MLVVICTACIVRADEPKDVPLPDGYAWGKVTFEERAEDGISKQWLSVSKGIEVVPEDNAKPDGNKVLRLPEGKLALTGPPVASGNWRWADEHREAVRAWSDYELSFRFKPGRQVRARRGGLLCVTWRVHPLEDSPGEKQLLYILSGRLRGPLVGWFGVHERFDKKEAAAEPDWDNKPRWHHVRIRVVGTRLWLIWNGTLVFQGTDDRIPAGGFAIQSIFGKKADPGHIDLDDIVVRSIVPEDKK